MPDKSTVVLVKFDPFEIGVEIETLGTRLSLTEANGTWIKPLFFPLISTINLLM